ncbi:MAG TPA: permease-like cell division protein FtsX [Mycobacteriales bacterium]|nr:permease-like cell division protein FtsX [Mycobacteriales bacterium]
MRRLLLSLVVVALAAAGCSGSSGSDSPASVVGSAAPNLQAFLRLPVATPSACPSNVSGSTDGRTSVWAGRVDMSVFVSLSATTGQVLKLGATLKSSPLVQTVYFESKKQAYEEFQRLYTCWASVPSSQTPASYRVDLKPAVSITARDALVTRIARMADVDTVSCNPVIPCTSSLPSAKPSVTSSANSSAAATSGAASTMR